MIVCVWLTSVYRTGEQEAASATVACGYLWACGNVVAKHSAQWVMRVNCSGDTFTLTAGDTATTVKRRCRWFYGAVCTIDSDGPIQKYCRPWAAAWTGCPSLHVFSTSLHALWQLQSPPLNSLPMVPETHNAWHASLKPTHWLVRNMQRRRHILGPSFQCANTLMLSHQRICPAEGSAQWRRDELRGIRTYPLSKPIFSQPAVGCERRCNEWRSDTLRKQ